MIPRVVAAAAALALIACSHDEAAAATDVRCGTKELYGKTLSIHVVGDRIPCSDVRTIVRGTCRAGTTWSCFSFRAPDPLLVWFKERERFSDDWSTAIEARRYPCRQARVTPSAWTAARRSRRSALPTRMQMLADDLVRCKQLRGKTYRQARALLGRPDETEVTNGKRYADWAIGPERDSFFQVDSEYLALSFGADGQLDSLSFRQG